MNGKIQRVVLTFSALALGSASVAAQQGDHMAHMMTQTPDARQSLDFPPPMRQHMLANMRDHLEALSEILAALSAGDAAKAGVIAKARLGLESAGAAACNPSAAGKTGAMGDMAAMMAQHMPEEMRALGYAMHDSASKFVVEAAKTAPGGDLKPALATLAQMTQNCAACHSAYRLK
jgi:cytochrome c556